MKIPNDITKKTPGVLRTDHRLRRGKIPNGSLRNFPARTALWNAA